MNILDNSPDQTSYATTFVMSDTRSADLASGILEISAWKVGLATWEETLTARSES